jgi:hypothetical protein
MGRALGANAKVAAAFETTVGTTPVTGFFSVPLSTHSLGEEQPLITSDLIGLGREPQDPVPDVITNAGDIVVPVDVRNFWYWLKLAFGAPVSTTGSAGEEVHTFTSGAASLPSMSIEIGAPEVPAYSINYGARLNQLKISLSRSGLLSATCSLIAIGESAQATISAAGTPTAKAVTRFAQATGAITKDGAVLGSVVQADFTFSNNLDPVETIKADGRIEDSDPGMVMMSGSITVRFKDEILMNAAANQTPCALSFGWTNGLHSLIFNVPRVFLPKAKRPITGPKGIQAQFNWQASGASAASVTVVLTNDVTVYA